MALALVNSEVPWRGKHTVTLVNKDGVVMEKTIASLRRVFTYWDGTNPFGLAYANPEEQDDTKLQPVDFASIPMEIVGKHEVIPEKRDDDGVVTFPERMGFKIEWLNPPGGGGTTLPVGADRKSIMNTFGSKFRALAGGQVKRPATTTASSAPKPAPAPTPVAQVDDIPFEFNKPEPPAAKPAVAGPKSAAAKPPGKPAAPSGKPAKTPPRKSTAEEVWDTIWSKAACVMNLESEEEQGRLAKIVWVICPNYSTATPLELGDALNKIEAMTPEEVNATPVK
jgi:hypothetical protein